MHGTAGFMFICYPVPQVFRTLVHAAHSVGLCYSKEPSKCIRGLLANLPNPYLQEDSILLPRSTRRETPSTAVRKIVWDRPWHQMWRNTMENCLSIMSTSCFCIILALMNIPISLHQPLWLIWLGPDLCSLYNSIKAAMSRIPNSRMKPACNIDLSQAEGPHWTTV